METILKKSVRNGIIVGIIFSILSFIYYMIVIIKNGYLDFITPLFAIIGAIITGVYFIVVGLVLSLVFYYLKQKFKK